MRKTARKCYITLSQPRLKELYQLHVAHCRKIRALEHAKMARHEEFHHDSYIKLIRECLKNEFLDEESVSFIEHLLNRYEIDYRVWAYRSRYVKNQISLARKRKESKQLKMNFNIPLELISNTNKTLTRQWSV